MRRLVIIALVGCLLYPVVARAADAVVLPAGRTTTYLENLFYFNTSERFGPHGNPESISGNFNERRLDSSVSVFCGRSTPSSRK